MLELVEPAAGAMPPVRYMIDASHNLKDPIEDLIQATDQIQCTIAQALLVDRAALRRRPGRQRPCARAAEILHGRVPLRRAATRSPKPAGATAPRSTPLPRSAGSATAPRSPPSRAARAPRSRPVSEAPRERHGRRRRLRRVVDPGLPHRRSATAPRSSKSSTGTPTQRPCTTAAPPLGLDATGRRGSSSDSSVATHRRTGRVHRRRHVGRRLRTARPRTVRSSSHRSRTATRAPTATGPWSTGSASDALLHDDRAAGPRDQHDLPARGARPRATRTCSRTSSCCPSSSSTTSPGVMTAETSSAGTTGLLDLATGHVVGRPCRGDRDPRSLLLATLQPAGTPVGIVARRSPSTSSAVTTPRRRSSPGRRRDDPFVATGTWLLVGREQDEPDTCAAARPGFTNEQVRSAASASAQRRRVVARRRVPPGLGRPDLEQLLDDAAAWWTPGRSSTHSTGDSSRRRHGARAVAVRRPSTRRSATRRSSRCAVESMAATTAARSSTSLARCRPDRPAVTGIRIFGGGTRSTLLLDALRRRTDLPGRSVRSRRPPRQRPGPRLAMGVFADVDDARATLVDRPPRRSRR